MSKLKLSLEELSVDSFSTQAGGRGRGTVLAHGEVKPSPDGADRTWGATCANADTCYASCYRAGGCSFESCPGTCPMGATCYDSCDPLKCPPQDTTTLTSRA